MVHLTQQILAQTICVAGSLSLTAFAQRSYRFRYIVVYPISSFQFLDTQQLTIVTHVNNPSCQSLRYVVSIDSVTHTTSLAYFCLRIHNYSSLPL